MGNIHRTIIAPLLGEGKHKPFAQCSVHASSNMHINFIVTIIVPFSAKNRKENAQKTLNLKRTSTHVYGSHGSYTYVQILWYSLSNSNPHSAVSLIRST